MGIRFYCPNGHKLNVKEFQAGRKGICPFCGAKIRIPLHSTRPDSGEPGAPDDSAPSEGSEEEADAVIEAAMDEIIAASHAPAARPPAAPAPTAAPAAPSPPPDGPASGAGTAARLGQPPVAMAAPSLPEEVVEPAAASLPPPAAPAPQPAPPVPDPIAEAPEMIWYVRPPSGGQFGPAAGSVMRSWLAEGRLSAETLVWREGWRDWQEAGKVFPQLNGDPSEVLFETPPLAFPSLAPSAHPHRPRVHRGFDGGEFTRIVLWVVAVAILLGVFLWVLLWQQ
jgi:hypothetical protein